VKAWHCVVLCGLALLAAALILLVRLDLTPASAQQVVVRIDPSTQEVGTGTQFTVRVMVDDVTNLGSYEFTLQFDPGVVTYESVANSDFLGSTGRQVFCPPAIVDVDAGTVRFGCGSIGVAPGASGSGQLAEVTFTAAADGVSPLDLIIVSLSDPLSNDIPASPQNGSVTVGTGTPGPTPTPVTPTPTPTPGTVPSCGGASGHTVACIQPAGQVVENGSNFSVDVVVNNVTNLGAYQFSLEFDAVVMAYVSAANGPFLGSSGRTVSCDPPSLADSNVRLVCRTLGSAPSGPSGDGVLATVTFSAIREGIGLMDLKDIILTDIRANILPMDAPLDGSVVVVPAPTPTPGPSPTPSITPTPTESPSPTPTFTVGPSPTPTLTLTPTLTPTPSATPTVGPTPTYTPTPGPVMVRVAPAWQEAALGVPFTVDIVVDNVVNLGAYEFSLSFNSTILRYAGAANGSFLGSSGRSVWCPVLEWSEASVRMACVTLGPEPPGPSGSGVLATVTFLPVDTGEAQVEIEGIILTDPMAKVIDAGTQDGSVTVGPAPEPTATPLPTSTHTPGPSPTPTETPTLGPPATPTPTATFVPGTTAVVIDPASQEVLVGQYFTVDVMAQNVNNLGAYEFTLRFNPNVINYVSVSNGWFLGSTGRSVFCPTPIADGWILRFGCVTTGVGIPGASGSGQLAQVVFRAAAPGTIRLDLSAVALADPLGATINAAIASGSVTVLATGAASSGSDFRPGFLAAAAVLTGTVGLLLRPGTARAEGRRFGRMRRRWRLSSGPAWDGRRMVGFMKSLWRRIIT